MVQGFLIMNPFEQTVGSATARLPRELYLRPRYVFSSPNCYNWILLCYSVTIIHSRNFLKFCLGTTIRGIPRSVHRKFSESSIFNGHLKITVILVKQENKRFLTKWFSQSSKNFDLTFCTCGAYSAFHYVCRNVFHICWDRLVLKTHSTTSSCSAFFAYTILKGRYKLSMKKRSKTFLFWKKAAYTVILFPKRFRKWFPVIASCDLFQIDLKWRVKQEFIVTPLFPYNL